MNREVCRKILMTISILLFTGGSIGFVYSMKLPAYKNDSLYQSQYMSIAIEPSSKEASKQFHELRNSQLTNKYKIQDSTLTLAAIGLVLLIFSMIGADKIIAPKSKRIITVLGISTALITSMASLSSLFLDYNRGEFPWWADSLAIPLFTQELPLLAMLVIWASFHFLFLRGNFEPGKKIFRVDVFKNNYWLSFIAALSLVILIEEAYFGRFMMVIPGSLWIYFYLSLAAGRVKYFQAQPTQVAVV